MVEQFIGGQEIQVAVLNNKPIGAIELVPKRLFYDYKAKYTKKAKTKHVMPARLSKIKYNEVLFKIITYDYIYNGFYYFSR